MPHEAANTEPLTILQGTDIAWTKELSDFDSATDTLEYVFSKEDGTDATLPTVTVLADGDGGWDVTITNAETTGMEAGRWIWQSTVTDAGALIHAIDTGFTEVVAAAGVGVDTRPLVCQIHEAVLEVLADPSANPNVGSYSVGDRNISYRSNEELQQQEAYYGQLCRREREAVEGKNSSKVISFFP